MWGVGCRWVVAWPVWGHEDEDWVQACQGGCVFVEDYGVPVCGWAASARAMVWFGAVRCGAALKCLGTSRLADTA